MKLFFDNQLVQLLPRSGKI